MDFYRWSKLPIIQHLYTAISTIQGMYIELVRDPIKCNNIYIYFSFCHGCLSACPVQKYVHEQEETKLKMHNITEISSIVMNRINLYHKKNESPRKLVIKLMTTSDCQHNHSKLRYTGIHFRKKKKI
jgi:hypothetical protein